jgi:hypothetical protein
LVSERGDSNVLCHYLSGLREISQSNKRKENGGKEDEQYLLFLHFLFFVH